MSCLRPKPRAAAADRCTEVTITKMQLTATNGPGGRKYLPPPRRRNTTYLWLMVYLVLQNIAKPRRALCLYMGGYKTLRSRNRENCLSLPRYPRDLDPGIIAGLRSSLPQQHLPSGLSESKSRMQVQSILWRGMRLELYRLGFQLTLDF